MLRVYWNESTGKVKVLVRDTGDYPEVNFGEVARTRNMVFLPKTAFDTLRRRESTPSMILNPKRREMLKGVAGFAPACPPNDTQKPNDAQGNTLQLTEYRTSRLNLLIKEFGFLSCARHKIAYRAF
jgi:hypothetical protein